MPPKATKRAKADLSKFLGLGLLRRRPTPQTAIDAFVQHYRQARYAGCDPADEADTLLFQYGVFDWGNGANFELDFTRQFVVGLTTDDHQMEQLHLTFFFEPELGKSLERFSLWNTDCLDLNDFARRVRESPGFQLAESQSPAKWELSHELV